MSEFTKGPWGWIDHGVGELVVYERRTDDALCILDDADAAYSWKKDYSTTPEAKANASLIAAAPDLHGVCTEIESPLRVAISMLRRGTPSQNEIADELQLKLGDLCTALAKANGQEKGE